MEIRGLSLPREELRRELLRRLALMEREVRALGDGAGDPRLQASIEILEEMERELRQGLSDGGDAAGRPMQQQELIELWRRHRREFEKLAAEQRRKHPARSGRRDSGPRW